MAKLVATFSESTLLCMGILAVQSAVVSEFVDNPKPSEPIMSTVGRLASLRISLKFCDLGSGVSAIVRKPISLRALIALGIEGTWVCGTEKTWPIETLTALR